MTDYYEQELDRLHLELRSLYSLGRLTPAEQIKADGLWARIERLDAVATQVRVRESKHD